MLNRFKQCNIGYNEHGDIGIYYLCNYYHKD